jgi:hypothetical protein
MLKSSKLKTHMANLKFLKKNHYSTFVSQIHPGTMVYDFTLVIDFGINRSYVKANN